MAGARRVGTTRGTTPYAELSCQSAFSFQRGASEPEVLVARAAELGYAALALTDRDALYGNPRFHLAAKAAGLPAVHGLTLTLARAGDAPAHEAAPDCDGSPATADDRLVLLAESEAGWSNLCRLVSAARHRSRKAPVTPLEALPAHAAGLVALAGPHLPEPMVTALREIYGPRALLLAIHDRLLKRDRRGQLVQRERGARLGLPLVVTGGVRFARRTDKPLHDVLTCVRHGVTLEEATTRLLPNAEFCLRPVAELARLFRHCPAALTRSAEIAARCRFSLDRLAYRFPPLEPPPGETQFSHLHRLVQEGARERYRPLHAAAARQIARELDLIERLDLAGYFLLVHEIVRFCEEQKILCQGRGSAANSAVCYALGITSVDPVGMGLLFERFLSENRGEMPDIDLDIEHQRREEVLQWVYTRHGRERAALAAEVVTYRTRSAVRDAGKALGFSLATVDALAKSLDRRWDGDPGAVAGETASAEQAPTAAPREPQPAPPPAPPPAELPPEWAALGDDARLPHLLRLVQALDGLPRHLSIHVGGMIITGPPLTDIMPVEPAAMPGRTVVPWDKDDLSALGILKVDLLGLGMLTVLAQSFRLVNGLARDAPLALHTVPADDAPTWDMLCAADTVGVFQVESRAQMNCLPRLKPRRFYDLVVEVALIRPGPIQGHMVHPYLRRRAGREAISYPHASLRPILERTLGVPLFQEQGMRIAMEAAGFTGSEADELRRAMGHKRSRQRMAELQRRLLDGLVAHGVPRELAQRIFEQLAAFADYGFPESHAASFARLAWASAWLKRHHPAPFLCALLNAQPMGFYPPAVLVSDAQRHGVLVLPVDVLQSAWDSTLQWSEHGANGAGAGTATHTAQPVLGVRLGLCTVRGLGPASEAGVRAGLASVERLGPFVSPVDVARRCGLDRAQMESLARLGALAGFEARRRQALWQVATMARRVPGPLAEPLPAEGEARLPLQSAAEIVSENLALGGVSVERHPLELLRVRLAESGVLTAAALGRARGEVAVAGMVICRQRPPTAGGLTFVTIEDETGFANLIVTPEVATRDRAGLRASLVLAVGRVEHADGVVNLRAGRLRTLDIGPLRGQQALDGLPSHDYR
ncbi:MAG: DNA polymerase III subunit alpha [Planctomycetota bacterium]